MSGLVPLSTIEDDFYVFDEARRKSRGSPHAPHDPARRQAHRASRQGGQVQKAGGFLPRRRGRQGICDAATGIAAQCSASAAISTRHETPAIVATGKFAPSGFASGQIPEFSPIKRTSAKFQARRVSNFRFKVFYYATAIDKIQQQPAFLAAAAINCFNRIAPAKEKDFLRNAIQLGQNSNRYHRCNEAT